MIDHKKASCTLGSIAAILLLAACGGADQQQQQQQQQQMTPGQMPMQGQQTQQQQASGGAPHTMTDAPGGWKKVSIMGTSTTFEMPAPIDAQQLPDGTLRYVYKPQGSKVSYTVGVSSRNLESDRKKGVTNEQALEIWTDQIIQANLMTFNQMKLNPKIDLVGKFNVGNAQSIQYSGKVGKADVTYICYVTDLALYYLEVITQNPQSPDVKRFIDSFRP